MKIKLIVFILALIVFLQGNIYGQTVRLLWKNYKFSKSNFSVESPYPLKNVDSGLRGQMNYSTSNSDEIIRIDITSTELEGDFKKTALKNIPGIMAERWKTRKYTDIKYASKPSVCSGYPAILTTLTCKDRKVTKVKLFLDVKVGNTWCEVLTQYVQGNIESENMAKKVIASFKILK